MLFGHNPSFTVNCLRFLNVRWLNKIYLKCVLWSGQTNTFRYILCIIYFFQPTSSLIGRPAAFRPFYQLCSYIIGGLFSVRGFYIAFIRSLLLLFTRSFSGSSWLAMLILTNCYLMSTFTLKSYAKVHWKWHPEGKEFERGIQKLFGLFACHSCKEKGASAKRGTNPYHMHR